MTDDWRARAVPAVYPSRRLELAELDERPKQVDEYKAAYKKLLKQMGDKAAAEMFGGATGIDAVKTEPVYYQFPEKDADDYARPAKAQPPSPLHGIPASIYSDMRALQCLVEKAPLAAWRIDGLTLFSSANSGAHRRTKAKWAKEQRQISKARACLEVRGLEIPDSIAVLIVREYCGRAQAMDESDNLQVAGKHVIDGIADALKRNDRNIWARVAQVRCESNAVRVLVVEGPTR